MKRPLIPVGYVPGPEWWVYKEQEIYEIIGEHRNIGRRLTDLEPYD